MGKFRKVVWEKGLISEACIGFRDFHLNTRPQIIKGMFSLLLFPWLRKEPGLKCILSNYYLNERVCFRVHTESIPLGLNICVALKISGNVRAKCLEFIQWRIFYWEVNETIISGKVLIWTWANKKDKENFYLHVHAVQPLTQYQLVLDLKLTKRIMRHNRFPHI